MNNSKTFLRTEPVGSLLLRLALPTVGAYGTILMYSFMKNIPDELLSAACGLVRSGF